MVDQLSHSQSQNIHTPINLYYPTAADREAGLNETRGRTISAANLYQAAFQIDQQSVWMLLQVTPSIIWMRLDSGWLTRVTDSSLSIYVDNLLGDDSNEGSLSAPYASFDRALDRIEGLEIRHAVRILLTKTGTAYTTSKGIFRPKITGGGSLSVIGVGTPEVTVAGPFTATGVSVEGVDAGFKITATGAGWSTDQLYGNFVRCLSGSKIGYAYPVFKNDSDEVWFNYHSSRPAISDTFDVVSPGVTLVADNLTLDLSECQERWDASWHNVRFSFCNLVLDFSSSTLAGANLTLRGEGALWMDFVKIVLPATGDESIMVFGGSVNSYLPLDSSIKTLSQTGLAQIGSYENCGLVVSRSGGPNIGYTDAAFYCGCKTILYGASIRNKLLLYENSVCRGDRLAIGKVICYHAFLILSRAIVNGQAGSKGLDLHDTSRGFLNNVHVLTGDSAVRARLSRLNLTDCTCDPSLTGYGLLCSSGSFIITGDACASLKGISGEIQWRSPNPDTTGTWPTANGSSVTDGQGSYVNFEV